MRVPISIFVLFALMAGTGCDENYTPKPKGYFRIALPSQQYDTLQVDCPYSFEINENAQWRAKENCWADLRYPKLRATLQLTYKPIEGDNLETLLNEGHRMAYEHTVKAAGIEESLIYDEEDRIYGVIYDIEGDAATNSQFFVTDSTQHFLRGVLYFYAVPNADSLRPVNDFMKEEILHLVNTLEWKNS